MQKGRQYLARDFGNRARSELPVHLQATVVDVCS